MEQNSAPIATLVMLGNIIHNRFYSKKQRAGAAIRPDGHHLHHG
jgi:hypothetical protein